MILHLPNLPPTTNQSLMAVRGRLIHTARARSFRTMATETFKEQLEGLDLGWLEGQRVKVTLELSSKKWMTKAGSVAKRDIANLEKLLVDSLAEALNAFITFDDSWIWELRLLKVVGDEGVQLKLEVI